MRNYVPPEPLQVTVEGRRWRRFTCSYDSTDGQFSFDIYALSHEHAELLLDDLKRTAKVDGEICGTLGPNGEDR